MEMQTCDGCADHRAGEQYDPTFHVVTVLRVFFDDHRSRGLLSIHSQVPAANGALEPDGKPMVSVDVVKATSSTYTVRLTMDAIMMLRDDAECWSEYWEYVGTGNEYRGLGMSAQATVRRIDKWLAAQR